MLMGHTSLATTIHCLVEELLLHPSALECSGWQAAVELLNLLIQCEN